MMRRQLQAMAHLAQTVLDSELADLKRISNRIAQKMSEQEALSQAQRDRALVVCQPKPEDLALLTGQDAIWQRWVDNERRNQNTALAAENAKLEEQLARARLAFGRAQAIEELQNRAKAEG